MRKFWLAAAAAAGFATPASAAVLYSNNFDAENGGATALNYNSFNGLTVTDGTVDLVASGDFGIICPGGAGACVDLDGSTNNSGLTSSASYAFGAGQRMELSFLFSGNQRGGADDSFEVRFNLSGFNTGTYGYNSTALGSLTFSFASNEIGFLITGVPSGFGPTDFTLFFTADNAGSASFSFEDFGNDNVGIVIDNVALAAVPEPSTWAMLILGFGVVGAAARRRRSAQRIAAT
jgi:hypothetical protein